MATTTAIILIGRAHPNQSGINPTHLIRLTENDRPALILESLGSGEEPKIIIPTVENTVDDIYLIITVFILKKLNIEKELHTEERKSIYDILDEKQRIEFYNKAKKIIQETEIKVVFNLLEDCHLLNQIELIRKYPNDYEVTAPLIKCEYSTLSGEISFKDFRK